MHFHVIFQFSCQNCYLRQANTLQKHQQFIRSNSNNSFLVTMNNLKSIENKTLSYIKILRQAVHKAIQRKLSSSARAPKSQLKHSHVNNPCKDRPDVIATEPCLWTFPCFPTKISALTANICNRLSFRPLTAPDIFSFWGKNIPR